MAVGVRQRWFSRRALALHLAILVWFPGCLVAGWWQVTRALGGNGLSYLYSVEWPVFAVVGVWGWWQLVHTDPETVGLRAQRRMAAAERLAGTETDGAGTVPQGAAAAGTGTGTVGGDPDATGRPAGGLVASAPAPPLPARRLDEEDDALRAYNDRLAELAARGPQTWRNR